MLLKVPFILHFLIVFISCDLIVFKRGISLKAEVKKPAPNQGTSYPDVQLTSLFLSAPLASPGYVLIFPTPTILQTATPWSLLGHSLY